MADEIKFEEIIDVPGAAQYEPPALDDDELKGLRTHRSPNWDGVTGKYYMYAKNIETCLLIFCGITSQIVNKYLINNV